MTAQTAAKRQRKNNYVIAGKVEAHAFIFQVYEIMGETQAGKPIYHSPAGMPVTDQHCAQAILAGSINTSGQSAFDFGAEGLKAFGSKVEAFKYFSLIGELYQMAERNLPLNGKKIIGI